MPAFSVNREKYSTATDVILNHPDNGILAFRVADIPQKLLALDSRSFHFGVEHDPEEQNYAHSEVRARFRRASEASTRRSHRIQNAPLRKDGGGQAAG